MNNITGLTILELYAGSIHYYKVYYLLNILSIVLMRPKENLSLTNYKSNKTYQGKATDPIDSINVLKAFLLVLQKKIEIDMEFANGQQVHLGMTLLLDCIGSKIRLSIYPNMKKIVSMNTVS